MHGSAAVAKEWIPLRISGCVCWLRSDRGIVQVGSKVDTWTNQASGVIGNGTQGTDALRPTYSVGQNGRPKLAFSASQYMTWGLDLAGAKTVALVYKLNAAPGTGYSLLSIKNTAGSTLSEMLVDLNTYLQTSFVDDVGSVAASGFSNTADTAVHASMHTYDGVDNTAQSSYTAMMDGVVQSVAASSTIGRAGTDQGSIGARDGGTFPLDGDVYEIVVYRRKLSTAELSNLWGYLKRRYAL